MSAETLPEPDPSRTLSHETHGTLAESGGGQATLPGQESRSGTGTAGGEIIAGKYVLIRPIGEGGMGTVYHARQVEPVKREVALKLIKSGQDSRAVIARFEAERQALALMDHPNIATVLDAGTTAAGQPFFVMELVNGLPITEYCDQNRLTPQQRLELFVPVCQAIQHAHQKGIIHRDIKPSNVLVTTYDGRPVSKVIDFGVAKATGPALTDLTFETAAGGLVGTPQYMSPEQATAGMMDVDTRSDVYSLGVLLYELLTGYPPFSGPELKRAGLLEMLRAIREDEPLRPSAKLSTADALPSLSANRSVEPKKLTELLRAELDWVVMKAISKDRSHRYQSASGFAADVQRYLAGEAVAAHPPNARYRLRKAVRRHRGPVVAAGLVLLALLVGLVGTTWGLLRANAARAAEVVQRDIAIVERNNAIAAAQAEAEQRLRAEAANQRAVQALESFTDELMEKQLATKRELTDNEKSILQNAVKQWEVYTNFAGDSVREQSLRANGSHRVAVLQQRLGLLAESEGNYRKTLAIHEKLQTDFPDQVEHRVNVAMNQHRLGALLRDIGTRSEAEERFKTAQEIREKLVADFPDEPDYQFDLASIRISVGLVRRDVGDYKAAERELRAALDIIKPLIEQHPKVERYRSGLGGVHYNLGDILTDGLDFAAAKQEYLDSIAVREQLVADFPGTLEHRATLASSYNNFGVMLFLSGDATGGEQAWRTSLGLKQAIAAEFPAVPSYQSSVASTRVNLGRARDRAGDREGTEREYLAALAILDKLVENYPSVLHYQLGLAQLCGNLAATVASTNPTEALKLNDRAVQISTGVYEKDPAADVPRMVLAQEQWRRAVTLMGMKRFADAVQDYNRVIEFCPPTERVKYRVQRANALVQAGQTAAAVAEVEELARLQNWPAQQWHDFGWVYAMAYGQESDVKLREQYGRRAVELIRQAVKDGYSNLADTASEPEFAPIHKRADFKALLDEAGIEPPSPPAP